MSQLTVRGFDEDLEREIRRLADHEDISLNKALIRLLRRGAGLDEDGSSRDRVGTSLDHLAGTWSDEQAREFEGIQRDFEGIDPELWK
jgi:hypothetical protein